MEHSNSHYIANMLAQVCRKPYLNCWLTLDFGIALIFLIAAFLTQIWWLLFISALALAEAAGCYVCALFGEVLREKDAEIDRLRRELGAV